MLKFASDGSDYEPDSLKVVSYSQQTPQAKRQQNFLHSKGPRICQVQEGPGEKSNRSLEEGIWKTTYRPS